MMQKVPEGRAREDTEGEGNGEGKGRGEGERKREVRFITVSMFSSEKKRSE